MDHSAALIGIFYHMKQGATFFTSSPARIAFHILFWICYVGFFSLLSSEDEYKLIEAVYAELLRLPAKLVVVYATLYWLIPSILLKKKYWTFSISLLALLLLAGFGQRLVTYYLIYPMWYDGQLFPYGDLLHTYRIIKGILDINSVVILTASIKILTYWYKTEKSSEALAKQKLEAELKFLKGQIHPHFLFNTLNNLYSLTLQKSDKAPQVVLKLSGLVNYMLYHASEGKVALSKELESIQDYLALESLRYGEELDLSFSIVGEVTHIQIAPLILLPFIENSFKHGVSEETENRWIDIKLEIEKGVLSFCVANSKDQNTLEPTTIGEGGIGLRNVERRLELQYPNRHSLAIQDKGSSFHVEMILYPEEDNQTVSPVLSNISHIS